MATLLLPKAPRNNLDVILGYRTPDIVSSIRKKPRRTSAGYLGGWST